MYLSELTTAASHYHSTMIEMMEPDGRWNNRLVVVVTLENSSVYVAYLSTITKYDIAL